jgi:hypothetical protein
MNPQKAKSYVKRYRALANNRSETDHELAGLMAEIRVNFPGAASGEYQFVDWITEYFEINWNTSRALADMARSHTLFPKREEWVHVGGWISIRFLLGLNKGGRRKVHRLAMDRAAELGRPIGIGTVRKIAFVNGVTTNRRGHRSNYRQVEQSNSVLRSWITELYSSFAGLPRPPEEVKEALTASKLAKIEAELAAE